MPGTKNSSLLDQVLRRLLHLLPDAQPVDWSHCMAASWRASRWHSEFAAHAALDGIALADLLHIDDQKQQLVMNTQQFLAGLPANNVLLWGSRGTGKSSLVHALLNAYSDQGLRLVEVRKEALESLAEVVEVLAAEPFKFVLFCDDLSFETDEPAYKVLKSALEGSVFKTADNVLIYATSNRRHLLPEYMSDNQQARMVDGELHEGESIEEKISLSDRFGLWLSFYPFRQDAYLEVVGHWVERLAAAHGQSTTDSGDEMRQAALQWALARGVRNGRTAQYFARHWVGMQALQARSQGEDDNS